MVLSGSDGQLSGHGARSVKKRQVGQYQGLLHGRWAAAELPWRVYSWSRRRFQRWHTVARRFVLWAAPIQHLAPKVRLCRRISKKLSAIGARRFVDHHFNITVCRRPMILGANNSVLLPTDLEFAADFHLVIQSCGACPCDCRGCDGNSNGRYGQGSVLLHY